MATTITLEVLGFEPVELKAHNRGGIEAFVVLEERFGVAGAIEPVNLGNGDKGLVAMGNDFSIVLRDTP